MNKMPNYVGVYTYSKKFLGCPYIILGTLNPIFMLSIYAQYKGNGYSTRFKKLYIVVRNVQIKGSLSFFFSGHAVCFFYWEKQLQHKAYNYKDSRYRKTAKIN